MGLIKISSEGLGASVDKSCLSVNGYDLWSYKNGFYAFEAALLVRPSQSCEGVIGVEEWNKPDLWKTAYHTDLSDIIFFAEDVFGGQFGIRREQIFSFDPETGEEELFAESFEDWEKKILADYDYLTGYTYAHDWQQAKGALKNGQRLVARIPFVCGGEYKINNFKLVSDVQAMLLRAGLAKQLHSLPDGSPIVFEIDNVEK